MTEAQPRTCSACQKKVIPIVELMPETFVHYSKISCPECGHYRWGKKPDNEGIRTKSSKYKPEDLGKTFCEICERPKWKLGSRETLQVHHKIQIKDGGPDTPENIWVLCTACHDLVHFIRKHLHHHLDNFYSFMRP